MTKQSRTQTATARRSESRTTLLVAGAGLILGALAFAALRIGASDDPRIDVAAAPTPEVKTLDGASPEPRVHEEQLMSMEPEELEEAETALLIERPSRVLPPAELYPRPESEWQGMRVDLSMQAICDGVDSCGLAMSCQDNQCGPCLLDQDCAGGESCVLDHCVPTRNVACRGAAECGGSELCVLSGYSADVRGNSDMRAYCQAGESGVTPDRELAEQEELVEEPGSQAPPRPVLVTALRDALFDPSEPPDVEPEPLSLREDLADAEPVEADDSALDPERAFFDEEAEERLFQQGDPTDFIDPPPEPGSEPAQPTP